jgi:hypothetical protein
MMTIETVVKEADGKGLGLFAVSPIKKGDIVWQYDEDFCKTFTQEQVEKMAAVQKAFVEKYAYVVPGNEGVWELDLDNGRFMNHSDEPNTAYDEQKGWAKCNISAGEEITCDYRSFDIQTLYFLESVD